MTRERSHDDERGPRGGDPGFGFGPFGGRHGFGRGGPRGPWGHGHRAPRGNARASALVLLAEQPRNGYQLMQEIEERSGGAWRPSPGSMYPILQQLADEGFIEQSAGGKTWTVTDEGKAHLEAHAAEHSAPWDVGAVDDGTAGIRTEMMQVVRAAMQVASAGQPNQLTAAREALAATRKKLYLILAEADEA